MAKTGFIFPGQGSQFVGMGRDLYDSYPEARDVFEQADEILGISLTGIMFGSGGDADVETATLKKTEFTQPALFVHSAAAIAALRGSSLRAAMAAGHSLGEYSALYAAKAISFEQGIQVVRTRGKLMGEAGKGRAGSMAAVLGLDDGDVEEVCDRASTADHVVVAANYNSVGQVVISGDELAVAKAVALATEAGARRAVVLPVSGAFHSPLMEHAREGLLSALTDLEIGEPQCPVFLNVTARPTTNPDEIRTRLGEQLTSPVRWAQTIAAMREAGADAFLEVGAGKVLSGLVKKTLGAEVQTAQAGTYEDLQELLHSTTT